MPPVELPPIDDFRRPFVEPLGCLTLLAAQCDQAVINVVALGRAGSWQRINSQLFAEASDVARHWRASEAEKILASLNLVDEHLLSQVREALGQYGILRERRHRAIHDALVVGHDFDRGAVTMTVGYVKAAGKVTYNVGEVTPQDIAALARDFGDLRVYLEHCLWLLLRMEPGPALPI
jgi:hypothetical protein